MFILHNFLKIRVKLIIYTNIIWEKLPRIIQLIRDFLTIIPFID